LSILQDFHHKGCMVGVLSGHPARAFVLIVGSFYIKGYFIYKRRT